MTFRASRAAGVLLLGPSGAGKSDLALRLVAAGAKLVSDDRTELFAKRGRLYARAPRSLAGLLEVRGVGIVRIPRVLETLVVVALELGGKPSRLPSPEYYVLPDPLQAQISVRIPLLRIVALEASAPSKVILAAAAAAQTFKPTGRKSG
ncbi:MAG: HPr kinase/phosphatase C-terminal domain-containing protein [Alphaproteobacteria bacterium]|nr:HPr kinase/phosphatase C-terminal domain-containing protein [Alphaproteobacteria bacterium]